MLCHHCCGHRIQLASVDAFRTVGYLRELERRIRSLYKQLERSGKAQNEALFWNFVCNEDVMSDLKVGRARWLSQLGPMRAISKSYITILSWLISQFESLSGNAKDKEVKEAVQWVYSFMGNWRCRVTVAACVDLLEIMMAFKCKLEPKDLHPEEVVQIVGDCKKHVHDYIGKGLILAKALRGAKVDGPTELEKVLHNFQTHKGDTIAIRFHRVSGARNIEVEKKIKFERFEGSAACVFETIEQFGKLLVEKLEQRFPHIGMCQHFHCLFQPLSSYHASRVRAAVSALKKFVGPDDVEERELVRQVRDYFVIKR